MKKCVCSIYEINSSNVVHISNSSSVESLAETQDATMVLAIRRFDNCKFWNNSSLRLNEVDDKIYQYQRRLYEWVE